MTCPCTMVTEFEHALRLADIGGIVVSYTAEGWSCSLPSTDPVFRILLADDDLPRDHRWRSDSRLQPHGTHAAFNRHKDRREPPCGRCRDGERTYQRERATRRRARSIQVRREEFVVPVDEVSPMEEARI